MSNDCEIEFKCIYPQCDSVVDFYIKDIETNNFLFCKKCNKKYSFHQDFVEKIKKFSRLIEAVQDAKEILGNTNVAIKSKDGEIKVPYRILLTRMNTLLTLQMDDGVISFKLRVEPLNEKEVIR